MPRTNKKTRQARKRKRAESLSKIPYQVLARDKEIMINPGVDLAVPWFYRVLLSIKALFKLPKFSVKSKTS